MLSCMDRHDSAARVQNDSCVLGFQEFPEHRLEHSGLIVQSGNGWRPWHPGWGVEKCTDP